MIKKFENFVNEAKVTGKNKNKDIMYKVYRLLDDINHHLLDGSSYSYIYEYIKKLESAYEHENIKKVIVFLTELRDEIVGSHRYKILVKRIDDILDLDPNEINLDEINWDAIDDNDNTEAEELKQHIDKELDDIDDDYPTNKGKTVEKFNLMKEVVRQYFDKMEMDNKLPGLSKKEIDDYVESDYNSERKQIRRYFGTTLDLGYNDIEALERRLFSYNTIERGFYYTLEDIKEICNVIIGAFGKQSLVHILKEILDVERVVDKKLPLAFRGKKLPLVVAVNGKVLYGTAYYNPIFDMYTETEEQMKYLIDKFKKSNVYVILTDYFENLPDVSEYELVDLKEMNRG